MTIRKVSLSIAAILALCMPPAIANEQTTQFVESSSNPISRETLSHSNRPSVAQLSDLTPDDWAVQALQSLANRYGCIFGYPNGTYSGDRSVNRYQFAAALSTCLARLNQQIAQSTIDTIHSDDLATVQRLQSDFATELATIQQKVDNLEARTANLTAQQFSTTTRFNGEAIFALAGVGGNRKADGSGESIERNIVFSERVRLELRTSFSGSDRLRMRLQARNIPELEDATGTQMANLGFDGNTGNSIEVDRLDYETKIGDRALVVISVVGGGLGDYVTTVNPLFSGSADGAVSLFARENPIRRQGSVPGIGLAYELTDNILLELGYIAAQATDPEVGIAQSPYAAVAQVTVEPTDFSRFSLTYVRSFNGLDTGTSSELAGDPFDDDSDAIIANSFGAEASVNVSPNFTIGGRVGYIQAIAKDLSDNPQADIFTWAVLLGFPDLAGEGNLLGIVAGQPLRVTHNQYSDRESDAALHLEAFYRLQINDNIAITPGAFLLINPENDAGNDPIYVGTIRTTFSF
ncbi:iron uptake porin [Chlorogloeopsis sp. ULAP01]|uniref:iron uptake porin n=1 Tax=Chlorogloeopsis sp. ULAP01 TaxID=3056483 RepID=UPI0025AA8303|nr:iron uptake porin [Chlorogloeopsis sp. ULAP01]MDM9382260.1 iron uptake porin [Chlorogloeopsis sp. ULAP01]